MGRVGALLDEAEALAEAAGDQRRLGRALNYKVIQFGLAGDLAAAIQAGLRALAIGESQADVAIQVVANGYLGRVYVARGECREAVRHCEAALALIPEGLAQERFGQATIQGSFVRDSLARALGALGRFAEAFGRLREAMHIAEEAGHVYSLLFPLFSLGTLKLDQGDFAGAVAPLERGLELCRTREVPLLLPDFAWALGAAYHGTGRRAEGVALMEDAARGLAERNVRWSVWAGRVGALGGAYLLDGRLADATRIAQDGLAAARQRGATGGGGPAPAIARRHRGPSRPLRGRYRGGALSPGPGPGRGAGHAPARRPLPPRPRQALPAHGQAPAGAGAPRHRDDDVPRDGHAVLAGAGGGGDEGVGMRTSGLAILGLTLFAVALTSKTRATEEARYTNLVTPLSHSH